MRIVAVGGSRDGMGLGNEEVYKLSVVKQLSKIIHFLVVRFLEGIKMSGHTHTHVYLKYSHCLVMFSVRLNICHILI